MQAVQGADSMLRVHDESQAAVLVTMHQTLSQRQHGLIGQMLEHLTLLQEGTADAELLDRSFRIDHLATRLRRMVESVSVVLGGQSLRATRAACSGHHGAARGEVGSREVHPRADRGR
ncbi:hypothetical protein ACRAWF_26600 [Streptomyces sp. L7]